MSTGLELVPIALAIGWALRRSRRGASPNRKINGACTAMTELEDAREALRLAGRYFGDKNGTIYGAIEEQAVVLSIGSDGLIEMYLDGAATQAMVEAAGLAIEAAHTGLVRERVRQNVITRATDFGLSYESERYEADGTIVLTLQTVEA